jgi:hypothetical protein
VFQSRLAEKARYADQFSSIAILSHWVLYMEYSIYLIYVDNNQLTERPKKYCTFLRFCFGGFGKYLALFVAKYILDIILADSFSANFYFFQYL